MMMQYLHTVRHLKPEQIYKRIAARLPRPVLRKPATVALRDRSGAWKTAVLRPSARTGAFQFRFLNDERALSSWNDPGIPKLWLYNLHYFDFPEPGLISRWIAENPVGAGNGWEPYPLSLRIVNWIKFALAGGELPSGALESLAAQTEFLSRRVEYHLLGNHLIANAKALLFAGAFFPGDRAARWLNRGISILNREIPEQILFDGGHFERSPMYHSLILEDMLDLVNLARAYGLDRVAHPEICGKMLGWLSTMTHPDGRIALFNDAAFGVAPSPDELTGYAHRLGIISDPTNAFLRQTGYIRMQMGDTVVFFDAAPIGPDYQPGHAHADTLSIELSYRGHRILVNSGTSTYQLGPERLRQRGTAAHNTVSVDGSDQSEVWSGFRVARRARPSDISFQEHPGVVRAEAAHDGYRRLSAPLIHRRGLQLTAEQLEITDSLEGAGCHSIESAFHLHPGVDARVQERNCFSLWRGTSSIGSFQLDPAFTCSLASSTYHPEFGLSVPNIRITARAHINGPAVLKSRLLFQVPS